MSTLFESYYDSLGHELHIGDPVMGRTTGGRIYGHVVEFRKDANDNEKYTIKPDIGVANIDRIKLKKTYKVGWKNVFLINVTKKKEVN